MISIIMTWRDRDSILKSMQSLVNFLKKNNGEFIIVNYGGNEKTLQSYIEQLRFEKIKQVNVGNCDYFIKSKAQNIGASHASNKILFFSDCDIVYKTSLLNKMYSKIVSIPNCFLTVKNVIESEDNVSIWPHNEITEFTYDIYLKHKKGSEVHIRSEKCLENLTSRSSPGLLMVHSHHYFEIQGHNSNYQGWGWEDHDMIIRLSLKLGLRHVASGSATHLSHSTHLRTRFHQNPNMYSNRDTSFRKGLLAYNEGIFNGTYQEDVQDYLREIACN